MNIIWARSIVSLLLLALVCAAIAAIASVRTALIFAALALVAQILFSTYHTERLWRLLDAPVYGEVPSAPGVWAAGDVARFRDRRTGEQVRIEHWVVAQRMGQAAARSMLGLGGYEDVPFFWSAHYDVVICVVGHAPRWDSVTIEGSLAARDAKVTYRAGQKPLAVATVFRDRESLAAEVELERA